MNGEYKDMNEFLVADRERFQKSVEKIVKYVEVFAEQEIECNFVVSTLLNGEYKDMNEFLVADRERFQKSVEKIVKYVEV